MPEFWYSRLRLHVARMAATLECFTDEFAMELFSQANLEIIRLRPDADGVGEKLL
jgi:hypothetical protein